MSLILSPVGEELSSGPRLSHPVTRDGTPIPFFPIGGRIMVERVPPEAKIGILHIPDSYQAPQQYATIVAAGPRAQGVLDDAGIKIGDTICFGKWAGVFFEWQKPGTEDHKNRRRVDMIEVGDIYGCKELAEKMIDGRLGLALYKPPCEYCKGAGGSCAHCDGTGEDSSEQEYRFMEEVKRG